CTALVRCSLRHQTTASPPSAPSLHDALPIYRPDTQLNGGNLLGRWTRRWSSTSRFQGQVYYDRTYRRVQRQYKATRDTFDIDTQDRKSTRLNSSHRTISYAVFCLKKKTDNRL